MCQVLQIMLPRHFCAERHKRQLGYLEELQTERDAHDRNAAYESPYKMCDRHLEASEYQPQDIHYKRHPASAVRNFLAERIKRDTRQLEALHTYRYSDYGNTPDKAEQNPRQRTNQSAKDYPQKVTK